MFLVTGSVVVETEGLLLGLISSSWRFNPVVDRKWRRKVSLTTSSWLEASIAARLRWNVLFPGQISLFNKSCTKRLQSIRWRPRRLKMIPLHRGFTWWSITDQSLIADQLVINHWSVFCFSSWSSSFGFYFWQWKQTNWKVMQMFSTVTSSSSSPSSPPLSLLLFLLFFLLPFFRLFLSSFSPPFPPPLPLLLPWTLGSRRRWNRRFVSLTFKNEERKFQIKILGGRFYLKETKISEK